ncbi:hypothetical protein, partial [Corynebacterium sp. KPL2838]|uniref:hypothetical protein n=1 Tax=Corynebacterium sp. KPL2838 TaxID=3158316 RepID=UPI0032EEE7E3
MHITQINDDGAGIELPDWGAQAIGEINLAKGVVRPWRIGYRIWRLNINLFWKTDSAGILGPVGYLLATFIQSRDLTPFWWTPDIQPSRAGKKGNLPP